MISHIYIAQLSMTAPKKIISMENAWLDIPARLTLWLNFSSVNSVNGWASWLQKAMIRLEHWEFNNINIATAYNKKMLYHPYRIYLQSDCPLQHQWCRSSSPSRKQKPLIASFCCAMCYQLSMLRGTHQSRDVRIVWHHVKWFLSSAPGLR